MLPPQLVLSILVEAFLGLLPRLKKSTENVWALYHGQNKAEEEYRRRLVVKISKSLKNVSKLYGMVWRVSCTLTKG